jgi:S1-C subfamily serine protease
MGKIFLFLLLCFAMPFGCIMLPLNRKVPISSFVQIYRILQIESCVKNTACEPQELISLGSGTVFKTKKNNSFILTASHVCHRELPEEVQEIISSYNIKLKILDYQNRKVDAEIFTMNDDIPDKQADLCILKIKGLRLPSVSISRVPPRIGDKVIAMAAPAGIYHPPIVPIFSGIYSGRVDENTSLTTVPALGGSSGAAVLNERMEIIGVIYAVSIAINNVSLMTNHRETVEFINKSMSKN